MKQQQKDRQTRTQDVEDKASLVFEPTGQGGQVLFVSNADIAVIIITLLSAPSTAHEKAIRW